MAVVVMPGHINIKIGEKGDEEAIVIDNPSGKNVCFKVKGTKLDKFDVKPGIGFVPSKDKKKIKLLMTKIFDKSDVNAHDHITVQLVESGDETDAKKVWTTGKPCKKYIIRVVYLTGGDDGEPNKGTKAKVEEEEDDGDNKDKSKKSKRPQGGASSKKPAADEDKTEPPEDLREVPSFQEFCYRRYE